MIVYEKMKKENRRLLYKKVSETYLNEKKWDDSDIPRHERAQVKVAAVTFI